MVSTGMGPAATSPPNTTRSTPIFSTSARTACRAGRLPWMSQSTPIRIPRLCVSAITLCAPMSVLDTTWPHGSQDAIGQAGEFLVWAPLIVQSGGGLHVFLPVLDRGLDALIHRLADGAYLALQVKTKTYMNGPEAVIAVYENHLFTPDQLVVGVHLDGDHLGPFVLVADAATFKRKAARLLDRGRPMLIADMPISPIPGHSWTEDLVPFDMLAVRLGAARPTGPLRPKPSQF